MDRDYETLIFSELYLNGRFNVFSKGMYYKY